MVCTSTACNITFSIREFKQIATAGANTVGSVSSRECVDAPTILPTFTAGCTGLVIV